MSGICGGNKTRKILLRLRLYGMDVEGKRERVGRGFRMAQKQKCVSHDFKTRKTVKECSFSKILDVKAEHMV